MTAPGRLTWWQQADLDWDVETREHDLDWAAERLLLDDTPLWRGTCGSSLTTAGTCPICDHYTKRGAP